MASREIYCSSQKYSISYQIKNPKCDEAILFLHGWGSNKELMVQAFCTTFKDYRHIYIDLPGFGNSSEPPKPIDSYAYAKVVEEFLQVLHVRPSIIMGHSFGGKVASLLNPKHLVLLSSAGIVLPKPLHVKGKIKFFKFFKNLLPKNAYRFFASKDAQSMSEVMYSVFKKVVDEDFAPVFSDFQGKGLLFWGKEDKATPLISGEKIHKLMPKSSLHVLSGDHYFFFKNAKKVEKIITEELG